MGRFEHMEGCLCDRCDGVRHVEGKGSALDGGVSLEMGVASDQVLIKGDPSNLSHQLSHH